MDRFYVYLLASGPRGTLYVGVTNELLRRTWEHREHIADGFTKKHGVDRLVWFEEHAAIREAILREKRLKRWRREWKIALVEAQNPRWEDLFPGLCG